MGFFSNRRVCKAVDAALSRTGSGPLDATEFEALHEHERPRAWQLLAERLLDAGASPQVTRSALNRAIEVEPRSWDAWSCFAQLEQQTPGRTSQALEAYETLLEMEPRSDAVRVELAVLLLGARRVKRAREVCAGIRELPGIEEGLRLGRALFGAELLRETITLLGPLRQRCELELRQTFDRESFEQLRQLFEEIGRVHDEAYAEEHGREAVVVAPEHARQLDAKAGVNYILLGESLMGKSARVADELALQTPVMEEQRGNRLLAEGFESRGRVLVGSSLLRQGAAAKARSEFERACAADGQNFAAFLGCLIPPFSPA